MLLDSMIWVRPCDVKCDSIIVCKGEIVEATLLHVGYHSPGDITPRARAVWLSIVTITAGTFALFEAFLSKVIPHPACWSKFSLVSPDLVAVNYPHFSRFRKIVNSYRTCWAREPSGVYVKWKIYVGVSQSSRSRWVILLQSEIANSSTCVMTLWEHLTLRFIE